MRSAVAFTFMLLAAGLTEAQQPQLKATEVPPRYGVQFRPKGYTQTTPRDALESVIAAVDKADYSYLVAHLLDPAFVDARVAERAKQVEPAVESELKTLRDFQKQNLDKVPVEARVPDDMAKLRAMIDDQARTRAFRQLVRDLQEKLTDDPEVMKDLRRFYRTGTVSDAGTTAKVALPEIKDRAVYLKKVGERWFVENRQSEEKAPEPKGGESKKDTDK